MEYVQRGINFARKAMCLAVAENWQDALVRAEKKYGRNSQVVHEIKSDIAGGSTTDSDYSALAVGESNAEFNELGDELSLFGRMQGISFVPKHVPVCVQESGAVAYWIGQSKATPVSRYAFARESMRPLRSGALVVISNELAESSDPKAEMVVRRMLIRAATQLSDRTFVDTTNPGVSGKSPASVTYGISPISGTGDLADDVEAALEAYTGSFSTAHWMGNPRLSAQAGIRSGGRGIACELGAKGGSLAGLPFLASESVAMGNLILVDASAVIAVNEGVSVKKSTVAAVEMTDDPQGATDTPVAASGLVSLFQAESTGVQLTKYWNYKCSREGAVVVLEGVSYSTGT